MLIIIVGAGRIGRNLSKSLSSEDHEVYLIESDQEMVHKYSDKLDVTMVYGSGSDPAILKKAHVEKSDLVLAVTTSDEVNLVVCSLAEFYGAKRRLARVRSTSLRATLVESGYDKFGVNEVINPELVAAEAIVKTVQTPGASEVADFADGKIMLRGFDIKEKSPLSGATISDLGDDDFPWPFLIVSIIRKDEVIVPRGDAVIEQGDH
ncbi:MAG: trk system potassium uptake protein TrkA, partial [Candidatus Omnitrophota bacterium]